MTSFQKNLSAEMHPMAALLGPLALASAGQPQQVQKLEAKVTELQKNQKDSGSGDRQQHTKNDYDANRGNQTHSEENYLILEGTLWSHAFDVDRRNAYFANIIMMSAKFA